MLVLCKWLTPWNGNIDYRNRKYNEQQTPDNGLFRPPWWGTFDSKTFLTGKTNKRYAFCNFRDTKFRSGSKSQLASLATARAQFSWSASWEYLPNLARSKWTKTCPILEVGELVLLLEDFSPRGLWPMGRVKSTIEGSDGVVRSCEISTIDGTFTRPVKRLSKILDLWNAGSKQSNLICLSQNGPGYVNDSLTSVNYSSTHIVNQLKSDCKCDSYAVPQDAPKEVFT